MQDKVFLLYPPITKQERYSSDIGKAGGDQIPLGIYYLASWLKKNGYDVKVFDAEAKKLSSIDIVSEIKSFSPQFIGISSTTVAFHRAVDVADKIKKDFPETPIIIGGAHVTSNTSYALSFNCFDYGVIGEGELTLIELLNALKNNSTLDSVKGIAYKKECEIIINPKREYIPNLDILPFPAFELIEDIALYTPPPSNYKTLPVINIITSRGCPNQCTFCDKNVFGNKYRERSAENIAEEIKYLIKKFNIKEFAFSDDTFLINKTRIRKLFEILDKERIGFYWTCASRINNVDFEFLGFIKSKGCWHLSFGIESGDENILKIIRKNISLDKARTVLQYCRKLGIKTKGFFIIGHPGETIETINKTIKAACTFELDDILVTINTPLPGSPQHLEAEKYGTLDKSDWSQYNCWRPVFIPFGLTKEILLKKHKEMYLRFYLKPRVLLRYFIGFFGKGGLKRLYTLMKASLFFLKNEKKT